MYNFIVDPYTNQKANINSKVGKQILKNYLRVVLNGGGEQVDEVKLGKLGENIKVANPELLKLNPNLLPSLFKDGSALKLRKEGEEGEDQLKICMDVTIGRPCQYNNNSLLVLAGQGTEINDQLTLRVIQIDEDSALPFSSKVFPKKNSKIFDLIVDVPNNMKEAFKKITDTLPIIAEPIIAEPTKKPSSQPSANDQYSLPGPDWKLGNKMEDNK